MRGRCIIPAYLDRIHLALGNRVASHARMQQVASELVGVSALVHKPAAGIDERSE